MSFHIVHVLQHASRLTIDRGCLVCRVPDQPEKRIPQSDVLALIIAARGVSFSADCLSSLIKNGSIILHCDERYRPIGKTTGLPTVVHGNIFERQIARQDEFSENLWEILLKTKIENQATVLDCMGSEHKLHEYLVENMIDEGNAARHYWAHYFSKFKKKPPKLREHQDAKHPINQMLNYSYAVMSAILHRSMLVHGLNPTLGIHHRYRFKSDPLLYDLFEPLRPICDFLLLKFHIQNPDEKIENWIKYVAGELLDFRVQVNSAKSLKLLYAIDFYASAIADCFYHGYLKNLFVPKLADSYFEKRS